MKYAVIVMLLAVGACDGADGDGLRRGLWAISQQPPMQLPAPQRPAYRQPITCTTFGNTTNCY